MLQITLKIHAKSFRDHAREQDASEPELAQMLKAHALSAVRDLHLESLTAAILQKDDCAITVKLRDRYADLPEEERL